MSRRLSLPLGAQIAGAILLTLLVAAVVVGVQVRTVAMSNTLATYAGRVQRGAMLVQFRLDSLRTLSQSGAVVLAQEDAFAGAWASGNVKGALAAAGAVGASVASSLQGQGQTALALYDPTGALVYDTARPAGAAGTAGAAAPAEVIAALHDNAASPGMRMDPILGLSAYGVAIVRSGNRVIGAVELSNAVDDAFAADTAQLTGTLVAFYDDDRTFAVSAAGIVVDAAAITPARETALEAKPDYVRIGSQDYLTSLLPVRGRDGHEIAYAYVGVPRSTVVGAIADTRSRVIGGVAIALVLGLALAAASTAITVRPLRRLVEAAEQIQANDLETPVEASGPREARLLAGALESMRLAIRQSRESLLMTNRRLAEQVDASTANLTEVTQELAVMHAVLAQLGGHASGGLAAAAEELLRLPWADGALIALASKEAELVSAATAELDPATGNDLLAIIRADLPQQRAAEGLVVPRTAEIYPALAARGVVGFAAMPMLTPEGIAGVVAVTSRRELALDAPRRRLLESITHEVASALEISELADEVEENRRIAEAVLREMSDGVVLLDSRAVCRACNPSAAHLLGRPREQIVGRDAAAFLPLGPNTIADLRRLSATQSRSAPTLAELDGRRLAITFGPFTDIDPARSGTIVLLRDLSAEAEAERVKQDFVSMVGHELRTPLTLIRTSVDLLREEDAGDLNPTQERIVGVLQGNSDRLMSLINDLLDMSALDSGRMHIAPEAVDLRGVVEESVEDVRATAQAKRIALEADIPPVAVTAWADRSRVGQVLSNLLTNAVKYTPDGGRVAVRLREERDAVRVEVRDSGIGIPPEEQPQLFEKFFRTTAGRRTTGGTGLGLAIARSIVELHGGEIRVESDGRTGSTFTFTLPRRGPA